jgi:hypothetical protein
MGFYVVNNTGFTANGFAYAMQRGMVKTGNAVKCEACGGFITMLEWLPPLEVNLYGRKVGDIIFGSVTHFIVSEKFKELYEKNGFTGIIEFRPIAMYKRGKLVEGNYFLPKIDFSSAKVDLERSGIVSKTEEDCCPVCQQAKGRDVRKINGIYLLDEDNIQEDIFCTKALFGKVIVSNKFKETMNDLSNLSFIEVTQYVWDCLTPSTKG